MRTRRTQDLLGGGILEVVQEDACVVLAAYPEELVDVVAVAVELGRPGSLKGTAWLSQFKLVHYNLFLSL